ncbi:HpcH/HpaI aldolase/citrate lyase family protein [Chelatococcus reniformis]|uniref:Citryl-CoA lyase n=1 Tax=Chelatococcus reniformis TaxID=1494448 RepID=A0A916XH98_9HYPH|nr:CoA ester lyase [Chelatococcus reniformis]GGC71750.1 citryl-CoA lyase [Chelatococcus reniformis]
MRSYLFVPGDSPKKMTKAMQSGADALILDLEDSVAAGEKDKARQVTRDFLNEATGASGGPRLFVRVNALDTGLTDGDLAAVMARGPYGIILPKSCGGADIARLGAKLAVHEAESELADGVTRIMPVATETGASVFALGTYAGSSRRLLGLSWGAEDLSADIGAQTNKRDDGQFSEPFRLVRSLLLFAAAAAGVDAIDSVFTNLKDLDALDRECRESVRDGFVGKLAVHPAQIPVIHERFTPSPDALAHAQAIVDAFAADPTLGVVSIGGDMIDRPHLVRAERVLARAGRGQP